MADAEPFLLERSIAHLLNRAQQVAADRFARKGHAITLRQFGMLAAVASHPGANQNDLVRITSVDRSTLADMLKRLQVLGLVEKSASPDDARANVVALTEKGAEMLRLAADDARKADQAVLDALPKAKREAFKTALQKLAKSIDEAMEKAEREERKRRKRELKKLKSVAEPKKRKPAKAQ